MVVQPMRRNVASSVEWHFTEQPKDVVLFDREIAN
jgi:hypothetical protein